jgi:hypothetical protein
MTKRFASTFVGVLDGTKQPADLADGRRVGANVRVISAVVALAAQASADTIVVGVRPPNSTFLRAELTTDTSLGTATLALGNATSAATYKAAGTFTATDTPTSYGKAAAKAAAPNAEAEEIFLTVGTAALPGAGNLVCDFYFAIPN